MLAGFSRLVPAVPLLLVSFAGCFGIGDQDVGGKAFDALDAPVWEAGYSWTYDVTASYHSTFAEGGRPQTDSETERDTFTLSVFNDTSTLSGEDVYFVRSSQSIDHPALQGSIQAIARSNLAVAGWSHGMDDGMVHYEVARPMPGPYPHSGYYPSQPKDPCEGVVQITPVAEDQRFPAFEFPIDDGQEWTGEWGNGDLPLFTYTSKVHGVVPVQVPAGVFPSVYVETDFQPKVPDEYGDRDFPLNFRIHSQAWYSPDVRYLTKMVVSASASGSDPDDGQFGAYGFDYVSTMQLSDFDLAPKASEPLSVVVREDYGRHMAREIAPDSFQVVSDQALPVELGNGPVTVTLGLERISDYASYDGRVATRTEVGKALDIDHATHEVVWMIGRYGEWEQPVTEIVGDTATVTLADGGRYSVQAHIRPIECGQTWMGYASGDLTTIVTKEYRVPMDPGPQRTAKVGTFQLFGEINSFRLEYGQAPTLGVNVDRGHAVLQAPFGQRRDVYASPYQEAYMHPPGEWRIEWSTDGPTVGDDVVVQVQMVYDPWYQG